MAEKEWFATWFDSPYYHLLYQNRDDHEARAFIGQLTTHLAIESGSKVLDLACGKGRHSLTLAQLGFEVLGADLAANSIAAANEQKQILGLKNLHFLVHDMRLPIPGCQFTAILNLFTSFGYFDALKDNAQVCQSIAQMLAPNGLLVIDFLNAQKVINKLVPEETIIREGIQFNITRWHDEAHIYKKIELLDQQSNTNIGVFTERVQALGISDFQALLAPYFDLLTTFGSYQLTPFDPATSDRLILIAKKKI